ncbi:helix-turn-helix domain-containing protein, partial [Paracraurococcus ruber]|uniref:helix-turn-helix domain-containing protein n=1 Tax=Paracraurococcus ruber TaxID=77675 RepID=UPI001057B2EA
MKRLSSHEISNAEPARLGAELRDARVSLGLTIEDVAQALRIRRVYLSALEDGRIRDLPAPAYAVGFVRTYARALGLDADEMVRRFREASGPTVARKTDLVFPEPVPDRGVPAGAVILGGVVLAIGAYVGWYQWSGSGNRVVDAVPPPPPAIELALREGSPPEAPAVAPSAPQAPSPTSAAAAPSAGAS